MVDEQGKILSHRDFCITFDIDVNFLQYEATINAIPKAWLNTMKNAGEKVEDPMPSYFRQIRKINKPSKMVYQTLRDNITTTNLKSEGKWTQKLQLEVDEDFWQDVYTMPRICTKETRLITFQYKIATRILPTNKLLYKCKLKETQLCSLCEIYTETLEHLFFECTVTRSMLLELKDWLLRCRIRIDLDPAAIILGRIPRDQEHRDLISHIYLIMKYYIYCCKLKYTAPIFRQFQQKLRLCYTLENMNQDPFQRRRNRDKWEPIHDNLIDPEA